jgi:hypothetical protein
MVSILTIPVQILLGQVKEERVCSHNFFIALIWMFSFKHTVNLKKKQESTHGVGIIKKII